MTARPRRHPLTTLEVVGIHVTALAAVLTVLAIIIGGIAT